MNFVSKITKLLEENMSERGFKLWSGVNNILPDIWDKPTSSTRKYHKKENGSIPNIDEHVFEMLYATIKIIRMFGIEKNTTQGDSLLMSIALHDSMKYGNFGDNPHTDVKHDKRIADLVCSNKDKFLELFNENEFQVLEESLRFHSGRWSSDVGNSNKFNFKDYNPETLLVHFMDMMSTADLIKVWGKDLKE